MIALPPVRSEDVADDREELEPGDRVLLIVEDDPHYGKVLLTLARDLRLQGGRRSKRRRRYPSCAQVSPDSDLARRVPAGHAWLDGSEPAQAGHGDPAYPVQILTVEEERQYSLERGAFAFMNKPVTTDGLAVALERIKEFAAPRVRELLVVEDDPAEQMSIAE
jgi:hypothetical protein